MLPGSNRSSGNPISTSVPSARKILAASLLSELLTSVQVPVDCSAAMGFRCLSNRQIGLHMIFGYKIPKSKIPLESLDQKLPDDG